MRYGGTTAEVFLEAGASPAAGQLIDQNKFIDTVALLGERSDTVQGGVIFMHTNIRAALLKQDQISFEHYSTQQGVVLEFYKGMRVFVSAATSANTTPVGLHRKGSTSGSVYTTIICSPGTVGWGEKQQVGGSIDTPVIDVASLNVAADVDKNNEIIYDRTRFTMHVNGTKWTGTPAGQSATNAELATSTNWALDYTTADRIGIVAIRTNG